MNLAALGLSLASLALGMGSMLVYFAMIPAGKVPVWPVRYIIAQGIAAALGATAIALSAGGELWTIAVIAAPALTAISLAMFFFWLLGQRHTPVGNLVIQVGDRMLAFEATDSDGVVFNTQDLLGKRTLFKFFRGGW